jgi:hypothetical protein
VGAFRTGAKALIHAAFTGQRLDPLRLLRDATALCVRAFFPHAPIWAVVSVANYYAVAQHDALVSVERVDSSGLVVAKWMSEVSTTE